MNLVDYEKDKYVLKYKRLCEVISIVNTKIDNDEEASICEYCTYRTEDYTCTSGGSCNFDLKS